MTERNSLGLFFTGSFDVKSTGMALFASGSPGLVSGTFPLYLLGKETVEEPFTLYLAAHSRVGAWQDLASPWVSYNMACATGAPTFCQDWEYIPYITSSTSGISTSCTLYMSGQYRGALTPSLPLFIENDGAGVIDTTLKLNLYAENNDAPSSGNFTAFMKGHQLSSSSFTAYMNGVNPSSSGNITMVCSGYGASNKIMKLFVSGNA